MTDLVPLDAAANLPAVPSRVLVHDAVRDQLIEELTGDQRNLPAGKVNRLDALNAVVDAANFNEVLHWLSSAKRAALPTKRGYAEDLAKIASWASDHFGVKPIPLLHALDANAITVWSVYARSQNMSVRTHRRILSAVSSFFTYAARHGWTVSNPVSFEDHARPVGTSDNGRPVGATRVLDLDELAQMRKACTTAEERLVFDLLHLQGLRESEVVTCRVEHINRDLSPAALKIQRKRGKWVDRQLLPQTQRNLDEHLDGRTEGPLLVDPKTGEARKRHQLIDLTRRLARRAKISSAITVTPHVLRASAITDLLDSGAPIQEVQQWAGHASAKTTQGYWERRNSVRRDAALTSTLAAMLDTAAAKQAADPEGDE